MCYPDIHGKTFTNYCCLVQLGIQEDHIMKFTETSRHIPSKEEADIVAFFSECFQPAHQHHLCLTLTKFLLPSCHPSSYLDQALGGKKH